MKKSTLLLLLFFRQSAFANNVIHDCKILQYQNRKAFIPPFQGKRHFCSDESKQEYYVTIKGNDVIIAYATVKIRGTFKKGLLFTNDKNEMEYNRYAGKHNYGKYYILKADYFSVLNGENGEYFYYSVCK